MEKTKRKNTKSLNITYPAPYSDSWNPDILPVLLKNDIRRNARNLPKSLKVSPKHDKRCHSNQIRKDFSSKKDLMIPATKQPVRKCQTTESPVIVFHNIDKSFRRQLSLSEMKHIDIKPKKPISGPPSPLPLPNFTISPRKITPIKP